MSLVEQLKEAIKAKITRPGDKNYPNKSDPRHVAAVNAAKEKVIRKRVVHGKPIDTSDHKLHKALEAHLGGQFEHFDGLKHGHNEEGHPVLHARVVHSYTADDLGMRPDEMEDTSETHRVKITKHAKGYTVSHHSGLKEEVELEETTYSKESNEADERDERADARAEEPEYKYDPKAKKKPVRYMVGGRWVEPKGVKEEVALEEASSHSKIFKSETDSMKLGTKKYVGRMNNKEVHAKKDVNGNISFYHRDGIRGQLQRVQESNELEEVESADTLVEITKAKVLATLRSGIKREKQAWKDGKIVDAVNLGKKVVKAASHATNHFKEESELNEKLGTGEDADVGEYVKDFKKSDAPQFEGKSLKKRTEMAIAAALAAMRKE